MQLLRCALQITLGLLLCLAASCAKDKAAPKSDTAGLVIAVQGEVSATRPGGVARMLHVDDTVFRDDTIVTGPNSSLEVELSHNGARWQLSAENERRVDSSLAWSAKRQSVAALESGQDIKTGSAGRNTTHEAAESRETLVPESEPVPVPDEEPNFAIGDGTRSSGDSIASKRSGRRARPEPSQVASPTRPLGGGTATGSDMQIPKKEQASPHADSAAASNVTRQEPPDAPIPGATGKTSATAESADDAQSSEAAKNEKKADDTAPSLRDHVLTLAKQCHARHGGRGALSVSVTVASGKASKVRVSGPDALKATQSCLDAALRRSSVLPAGPPLTTTISLP